MARLPAIWFFPGDWLRDPQLRMASPGSRGIWIDLLCNMWNAPTRGVIVGTADQLQRLASCTEQDFSAFLNEIETLKFGDLSRESNGLIRIVNRRMVRDEKARKDAAFRQRRHREGDQSQLGHAVVTASVTAVSPENHNVSSSSSSSSKTNRSVRPKRSDVPDLGYENFYALYPHHAAKKAGRKAWDTLNPSPELQAQIAADVTRRKGTQWRDLEIGLIPLPASYLNGERWNDEPELLGNRNGNGKPAPAPLPTLDEVYGRQS